ncbi:ferredoxin reductase family protein [Halomonas sp. E14]|uniref:ferredoxin reductase family protein n=1 Tax=Halomonas sp. E14 TaxID=3397245 RepID=UPI00403EDE01
MQWPRRGGDLLLWMLVGLPLAAALPRLGMPEARVESALSWLGHASGILALALMLLAAAVSLRVPGSDRPFGGLTRLWRVHHWLGYWAFILVMVHVLALALAALPVSLEAAVALLVPPPVQVAFWLGWLAWLALVIFLAPTFGFFGRPHYQRWKRLHLVSAVALLLALAHALPLAGERWPWIMLGFAGLSAVAWRKLLAERLGRRSYRVEAVHRLARDVVELELAPEDRPLIHEAGQFVYLTPRDGTLQAGCGEEHPYTLASAPQASHLRIGIKDLGDASHALQTVAPGSCVELEGPYGGFLPQHPPRRNVLWLGGGIGITPFVSAARGFAQGAATDGRPHLIYLCDAPERAYYLEELSRIAKAQGDFTVTPHYYRHAGAMSEAFLRQHCPDYREREVYLCGPPAMSAHLVRLLRDHGVPAARIHSEVFDFL